MTECLKNYILILHGTKLTFAFCLQSFLQPKVRIHVLSYLLQVDISFLFCVELNYKGAIFCKMPDCSESHLKMI